MVADSSINVCSSVGRVAHTSAAAREASAQPHHPVMRCRLSPAYPAKHLNWWVAGDQALGPAAAISQKFAPGRRRRDEPSQMSAAPDVWGRRYAGYDQRTRIQD